MSTDEKSKFERLKNYLSGNEIGYPSEHELETIFSICLQMDAAANNVGHRVERIEHNPLEKAFHDVWIKWNQPVAGVNHGNGILQDLFIEKDLGVFSPRKLIADITNRERWIVATIIQWLGTSVGMGFLHEVFHSQGMYIGRKEK